jgi:hypothetical protein
MSPRAQRGNRGLTPHAISMRGKATIHRPSTFAGSLPPPHENGVVGLNAPERQSTVPGHPREPRCVAPATEAERQARRSRVAFRPAQADGLPSCLASVLEDELERRQHLAGHQGLSRHNGRPLRFRRGGAGPSPLRGVQHRHDHPGGSPLEAEFEGCQPESVGRREPHGEIILHGSEITAHVNRSSPHRRGPAWARGEGVGHRGAVLGRCGPVPMPVGISYCAAGSGAKTSSGRAKRH